MEQQWISVEERLPKKYQDVLVYDEFGVSMAHITLDNKWFYYGPPDPERDIDFVQCWQPLPAPPTSKPTEAEPTLTEKYRDEFYQFRNLLAEQGFEVSEIEPHLTITQEDLPDHPCPFLQLRFEVQYPGILPICQYVQFGSNDWINPRNEWFTPGDRIFLPDKGKSLDSFNLALEYARSVKG